MKPMKALIALLLLTAVTHTAHAQVWRTQTVTIQTYDREIGGQDRIYLKQEILRQHPYINLQQAELLRVDLTAKSRNGRGLAHLDVGGWRSGDEIVWGDPRRWHDGSDWSFQRVSINNHGNSFGQWQIVLTGNIKVRRVDVTMRVGAHRPPPRPIPPRPIPPRPIPPGQEISIKCESVDYRENTCDVGGSIINVRLIARHSVAACREGIDWFWQPGSRFISVRNGCRANFSVLVH